ncbi:MAG: hypothetical protein ABR958_00440 [Dehalococcoidales bacterium]
MDKQMGILLMVVFGISGAGVTALAWFYPSLNLDKASATLAGVIGVGFAVFQGFRFKYQGRGDGGTAPAEAKAAEKP